ncbi:ATP-binding protein [Amycolatopsis suaedae]|nr:helix-turn-helix domain-containing protein [Amycolatopsis suaedae]
MNDDEVSVAARQFGDALRTHRRDAGLSLDHLAARIHIHKSTLSRLESGKRTPSQTIAKLCDQELGASGVLITLAAAARAEMYAHLSQLPAAPARFVGRDAQLAELDEATAASLDDAGSASVVLVAGPPGVGKTALALRWAHRVHERYEGVLFANLRGYGAGVPAQPSEILQDLLRGLGVTPDRIPAEEAMRGTLFRSLLHGRRYLIVLDNAVDSQQVRPVLPGMPTCPVLVTSRKRLGGLMVDPGATPVALAPLAEQEAAKLLATLIGPGRARGAQDAVDRVVKLCASLPLAVRIAGERIARYPHRTVDELAEEFGLEMLAVGDDDTINVRAAFSWSYRALSPPAARLFRLLGLHPGPRISFAAAAALAGLPLGTVRGQLEELLEAHLIQQTSRDYFQFHDLLRSYAAEEAAAAKWDDERAQAVHRLAAWYLHSVNSACAVLTPNRGHHDYLGEPPEGVEPMTFTDFNDAYQWCVAELGSITPVAQLALDSGLHEIAWRLPVELFDFHLINRPWETWISSHDVALAAAEASGHDEGIVWVCTNLAEAHRRRHDMERTHALYTRALEICERTERTDPTIYHVWALVGLGNVAHEREQYADAARYLERGVARAVELGYRFGEATGRVHLGRAYRSLNEREKAMDNGRRALEFYTEAGDEQGRGYALVPLARACLHFDDLEQALAYAEDAVSSYRTCGDTWGVADALDVRGCVLAELGRTEEAVTSWRSAEELVADLDDRKVAVIRSRLTAAG